MENSIKLDKEGVYTSIENVIVLGKDHTYDGESNCIVFGFDDIEALRLTSDGRIFINGELKYSKDKTGLYDVLKKMTELNCQDEDRKIKAISDMVNKAPIGNQSNPS